MRSIITSRGAAYLRASLLLMLWCWVDCSRGESAKDVVSGQGSWKYRFRPDLAALPMDERGNDLNGHGLAFSPTDGSFYFTFQPANVTASTRALVHFEADGSGGAMLGVPGIDGLSSGVPHGLRLEDDGGKLFLYHANNAQKITKTAAETGEIVWTADLTHWNQAYPQYWPVKPTQAIVVPGTDILLVADGYGSSFVHAFNKTNGQFLEGRSFGGKGNSTSPLRFNTPHGINEDARRPGLLVVSDRSNNRLVWITPDGKYVDHASTATPTGMSLPCNVATHEDTHDGIVAVVPSLGNSYTDLSNGTVAIYGPRQTLLSTIEVAKKIGSLGHQHPHDAIILHNGDIVICCWSGPPNPGQGPAKGTISYWERLPSSSS